MNGEGSGLDAGTLFVERALAGDRNPSKVKRLTPSASMRMPCASVPLNTHSGKARSPAMVWRVTPSAYQTSRLRPQRRHFVSLGLSAHLPPQAWL
jgi:hypothetical protein